mgnify:FL=1
MTGTDIPIFPLNTVLFPDGYLPLRIFEQRYIEMVRECSLNASCFGVGLINYSEDSNNPATHMKVGTTAEFVDFSTLEDGLLGITARGNQRFIINSTRMRDNGLLMGDVEILDEPAVVEIPVEFSVLSMVTGRFMEQLSANYPAFKPRDLQDANWVGYRLAELLPLDLDEKQVLLQMSDPLERLQVLVDVLPRFQEPAAS